MHQILVVEDEPAIRNVLRVVLGGEGYMRHRGRTPAARAEIEARSHKPDLLLVDLGLPDGDGLDVIRECAPGRRCRSSFCRRARWRSRRSRPWMRARMTTSRSPSRRPSCSPESERDLRRNVRGAEQTSVLKLGPVQIDLARRLTQGPAGDIHLTPLEYRVLECLARQAGMVVRQGQLLREVWGPDRQDDTRSLRVCIKYLRDKLEPDPRRPRFLVTETGLGYRLRTDQVSLAEKSPEAGDATGTSADR